ncbi:hypothetical protein D3C71_1848230 [compost metagenome]
MRMQAIKLKNSAFTGGMPCQWISPGACQNISDSGMYSAIETHIAIWKSGSSAISRVMVSPPR